MITFITYSAVICIPSLINEMCEAAFYSLPEFYKSHAILPIDS